ncbi:MAG: hypothetical protein HYY50_00410 [Candidatus Kerfeldbacteria bacterium]|nr:hypothetical protein [Candidatus Kerfeldbacteria bacterium]
MTFFIILGVIGLGALLVIKTQWFYNFTGPIDWAEQHLGTEGGTRLFIKLIGIAIILGAFLWVTGGLQAILNGIFKPFAQTLNPGK